MAVGFLFLFMGPVLTFLFAGALDWSADTGTAGPTDWSADQAVASGGWGADAQDSGW